MITADELAILRKPILCVDFDGVIHSYSSGWKGARVIPDPPVPGAIQFLIDALKVFDVCIYSSRSRYFGGRWAIKRWLKKEYVSLCINYEKADPTVLNHALESAFADPWADEIDYSAGRFISSLKFPTKKPAAFLQIDDRAITFTGVFSDPKELLKFKPWNKKENI